MVDQPEVRGRQFLQFPTRHPSIPTFQVLPSFTAHAPPYLLRINTTRHPVCCSLLPLQQRERQQVVQVVCCARMDLTCTESISSAIFADKDPVIFNDFRVIENLLNDERFFVPENNYFEEFQTDIQPYMRKVVTTWMLEVSKTFLACKQISKTCFRFCFGVLSCRSNQMQVSS